MTELTKNTLGIDVGSTTVKIAILDQNKNVLFSDYQRHFANIQGTLATLLNTAYEKLGDMELVPLITGSGGLTLAKHLDMTFVIMLHRRMLPLSLVVKTQRLSTLQVALTRE